MSKTSFSWLNSLCDLSFIRSSDLRKSSLNPSSTLVSAQTKCKTDKSRTDSPIKESSNSRKSSCQEAKRECSSPNRGDRDKVAITEKDFRITQVLSSGKNWRIYLVKRENEDDVYAMKLIGKKKMTMSCSTGRVSLEKEIMEKAKHPFIPKLNWSFENDKKIFLVMEYVEGGATLHHMLKQLSRFSEEITRFYSAEILLTLEHLHNELQIAHSDLKPRNLLLDPQGHIKLIDYSQAKRLSTAETQKDVTQSESKEATEEELDDYWKLGSLIYEMLTGKKPFSQEDETSGADDVSPTSHLSWPCPVSKNAKDLITRLLNRYTDKSMIFHSIDEIKKHAFFAQVNWEKMMSKSVYPPLVPTGCDKQSNECDSGNDNDEEEESEIISRCLKTSSLDRAMENSSFLNSEDGNDAVSFDRTTMNSRLGCY